MSNEITVRAGWTVRNGTFQDQTPSTSVQDDQATVGGGVPGQITVSDSGTDVDFTPLVQPTWCWLQNIGSVRVDYGVFDGTKFVYFGELEAGDISIVKLSRYLGLDLTVPGTGTSSGNTFRMIAAGGPCKVLVKALEK